MKNDEIMEGLALMRDFLGALFIVAATYFALLAGHAFGF
jgi:hypothetical protein